MDCYLDESDGASSTMYISPKFTRYWSPICDDDLKPRIGQCFPNFEAAFQFYQDYSRLCGFDVRRNTTKRSNNGELSLRYFVCNREGFTDMKSKAVADVDSSKKRRRNMFSRCGCNAKLSLKLIGRESVSVYRFVERHNHKLVVPADRHFLKSGRDMTLGLKSFVFDAAKVRIGASQAHGLMKELVGGYGNVGATARDFRNFNRDVKQFIGVKDAQIVLDKFEAMKQEVGSFYYKYEVDSSGCLTKLFWADPIGRKNYEAFGDVISFDATFGTNK